MSFRVLVDNVGHSDLLQTMHILFEERLGGEVYIPEGPEWVEKGYVTAHCPIPDPIPDSEIKKEDGITYYKCSLETGVDERTVKGITFDKFMKMDFDVILTTVYFHEKTFHALVKDCKPNAKYIRQIANIHEKPLGWCKNILLGAAYHPRDYGGQSADLAFGRAGIRHIMYYPEHYRGYKHADPINHKEILCLSREIAPVDWNAWNHYRSVLEPLGFTFKMYGVQHRQYEFDNKYGETIKHPLLPNALRETGFVWYTKPHGGGGFTVREAMATGRPVIVRRSYSERHTIVECNLFKHGINCVDLDVQGLDTSLVQQWAEPEIHIQVCQRVADVFQQDVKFEETSLKIKDWIYALPGGVG